MHICTDNLSFSLRWNKNHFFLMHGQDADVFYIKHLCSKEDRINVFINYARLEHAIQVKDSCPALLSQLLSCCQVGSFAPVTVWCFCHKRTIWLTGCVEGQL
ncbi:hypothetical protein T01_4774 [Trichinella spiralis]|uniref:Uncharacterized protein n=1 Tax=Trichinella spiralis TaxID=6334 RepID=A0A0V1AYR8_TRISP|nr:hypothetical protein T01_4774 [Trichinella spiralis]